MISLGFWWSMNHMNWWKIDEKLMKISWYRVLKLRRSIIATVIFWCAPLRRWSFAAAVCALFHVSRLQSETMTAQQWIYVEKLDFCRPKRPSCICGTVIWGDTKLIRRIAGPIDPKITEKKQIIMIHMLYGKTTKTKWKKILPKRIFLQLYTIVKEPQYLSWVILNYTLIACQ